MVKSSTVTGPMTNADRYSVTNWEPMCSCLNEVTTAKISW